MKVGFRKSFAKDLRKIKQKRLLQQVKAVVLEVEKAENLQAVGKVKQLRGEANYYRIRVADYRVGLKLEGSTVVFVRFLHRKEVYRYFP